MLINTDYINIPDIGRVRYCLFDETYNANIEKISIRIIDKGIEYYNNLDILRSFTDLEYDWNENGALPIDANLINKIRTLLTHLDTQPEIFPDADGHIQFEYEKPTGEYLNFEFFPDDKMKIYKSNINNLDDEYIEMCDYDIEKIVGIVGGFYAA